MRPSTGFWQRYDRERCLGILLLFFFTSYNYIHVLLFRSCRCVFECARKADMREILFCCLLFSFIYSVFSLYSYTRMVWLTPITDNILSNTILMNVANTAKPQACTFNRLAKRSFNHIWNGYIPNAMPHSKPVYIHKINSLHESWTNFDSYHFSDFLAFFVTVTLYSLI